MKVLKGQERKDELIKSLLLIDENLTKEELEEFNIDSLTELYEFNLKESGEQEKELTEDISNLKEGKEEDKPKPKTSKFDFISKEEFELLQESKSESTEEQTQEKPNLKRAQRVDRLYKSIQKLEKIEGKKFNLTIKELNKLPYEDIEELEEYLVITKTVLEDKNSKKWESENDKKTKEEMIASILKSEDDLINKSGDESSRKYKKEDLDKQNKEELTSIMKDIKEQEFSSDRRNQKKKMRNSKETKIQSIITNYSKLKVMGVNINSKNPSEDMFTRRRLEKMTFEKLERIEQKLKSKVSLEEKKKKDMKQKDIRQEKLLVIHKLKKTIFLKGGKVEKDLLKDLSKKDNQELDVVIIKLQKIESELPKINATDERAKKMMKKGVQDIQGVGKNLTNELKQSMKSVSSEIEQFSNSMN